MSLFYFKKIFKSYGDKYSPSFTLELGPLTFNTSRFIGIIGKSGSGKSTLLNLLAMIDKPDDGVIYYKGEPTCFWKEKNIVNFRNQEIGIVFQHYNLLNEHSVIFNIMLPAMIGGDSKIAAEKKAETLLRSFNFSKDFYKKKVANLSGGEKQRVAIMRSLINDPSIIFADEPTGALDEKNSEKVMQIFAEISKKRSVIMVSHNEELLRKYVDELIVIKDGEISQRYIKEDLEIHETVIKEKKKRGISKWPIYIVINNFKKRFSRNAICISALSFGLLAGLLIIGFSNGSPTSVDNYCQSQFNYGQLKIYKEKKYEVDKSGIYVTHQTKATKTELSTYKNVLSKYNIEPDLSVLVPLSPYISYNDVAISGLIYDPIYSFTNSYINKNLLLKGRFPLDDSLREVVINNKCFNYLTKELGRDALGAELLIQSSYENTYITGEESQPTIKDIFIFEKRVKIVGVIDEMDYLASNKIYYSYSSLEELLMEMPMENLSTYFDAEINWFSYVDMSDVNATISNYANYAFIKDIKRVDGIKNDIEVIKDLVLYSPSFTVQSSMKQLMSAADMGLSIFLAIILIGTSLILGIVSFSSYCEDKKKCAILNSLGANASNIKSIYIFENLIIGIISICIAFALCSPFNILINAIIKNTIGLQSIIDIPFVSFAGVGYLLPILIIISTILICYFSTILPISFGRKISIREELKDE